MLAKGPSLPQQTEVVVIGAGLSGLTAALELKNAGLEVVVLESSARVGGRVHTVREPFQGGQYTESGASRIPSNHYLTLEYVKRFGLEVEPFSPSEGLFSTRYQEQVFHDESSCSGLTAGGLVSGLSRDLAESTKRELERRILGPDLERFMELKSSLQCKLAAFYDQLSFHDLLTLRSRNEGVASLLHFETYGEAFKRRTSALFLLRNLALLSEAKSFYRIRGGNERLPLAMAKTLGDRVVFNHRVASLTQADNGSVKVAVDTLLGRREVSCQAVLLTLPPPALLRLKIRPELSRPKVNSLSSWRAVSPGRFALQFQRRFWLDSGYNGFAQLDIPLEIWDMTLGQSSEEGILEFYFRDEATSDWLDSLESPARVAQLLDILARLFPGSGTKDELSRLFVAEHRQNWSQDSDSACAYSVLDKGMAQVGLSATQGREGAVFFAGAYTSPWCVWMQGGIESGSRAAQEIFASLFRT